MADFKPFRGKGGLNLSMEFSGLNAAQSALKALPIAMGQGFHSALQEWAKDVLSRSQQLVPVNTGRLKSTGQVLGPEIKNGALEVHIGYGERKNAWYASIVHERLDVRHPSGQAKFLEQPLTEKLKDLDAALERVIAFSLDKVA